MSYGGSVIKWEGYLGALVPNMSCFVGGRGRIRMLDLEIGCELYWCLTTPLADEGGSLWAGRQATKWLHVAPVEGGRRAGISGR